MFCLWKSGPYGQNMSLSKRTGKRKNNLETDLVDVVSEIFMVNEENG